MAIDIAYISQKEVIIDFAENSDNKYLIAKKYAEKYNQLVNAESHKLKIEILKCLNR